MFHSVLARDYEDIVKLQLGETNSTSCGTPQGNSKPAEKGNSWTSGLRTFHYLVQEVQKQLTVFFLYCNLCMLVLFHVRRKPVKKKGKLLLGHIQPQRIMLVYSGVGTLCPMLRAQEKRNKRILALNILLPITALACSWVQVGVAINRV